MWNKVAGKRHQPFQCIQFKWNSVMFFLYHSLFFLPSQHAHTYCFIEATFENVYDFTRLFRFPYNARYYARSMQNSAFSCQFLFLMVLFLFILKNFRFFFQTLATFTTIIYQACYWNFTYSVATIIFSYLTILFVCFLVGRCSFFLLLCFRIHLHLQILTLILYFVSILPLLYFF